MLLQNKSVCRLETDIPLPPKDLAPFNSKLGAVFQSNIVQDDIWIL